MKALWTIALVFVSLTLQSRQLKVAVIDTGTGFKAFKHKEISKLCEDGHRDFTGEGLYDIIGHGTNVSGLISIHAQDANYCQLIYKYWTRKQTVEQSIGNMVKAIQTAIDQKVDFINISAGGTGFSYEELLVVKKALDRGITIVAAAGNHGKLLATKDGNTSCKSKGAKTTTYYPAMHDPKIIVVGSLGRNGQKSSFSNRGCHIDAWETGEQVMGLFKRARLSGTSQATAIHTGKLIYERHKKEKSIERLQKATTTWTLDK